MKFGVLWKTALAAGIAMAVAPAAQAQDFTFKLHHFLGAKAPAQTQMLEPWARAVEDNSGGRVKIEIFPAMTLGGRPPELVQQARDGVVDLVWTVNGYTPGAFPRTEVFELPTVFKNDPAAANLALHDMFESDLAQEYKGLEVMFLHVHAGMGIHMRDQEVRRPADLVGAKLRIPSRSGAIHSRGAGSAERAATSRPSARLAASAWRRMNGWGTSAVRGSSRSSAGCANPRCSRERAIPVRAAASAESSPARCRAL